MAEKVRIYDCAVVGGGPAGLTAALYLRRAGVSVVVFERESVGGQAASTPLIENFPGNPAVSGIEFSDRLYEQVIALGAKVTFDAVTDITPSFAGFAVETEYGGAYTAKAVILATGVKHRPLGVEREGELLGAGLSYCAVCDGALFAGRDVAVAGGGNSALAEALYLADVCKTVYLIHRRDTFRAEAAAVAACAKRENIVNVLDSEIVSLNGVLRLESLTVRNKRSGIEQELPVECLFVSVGKIPANAPFAALAALTEEGYIDAGEDCATKTAGVFVAGDCRNKKVRQITTAVSDGAIAALAAVDYLRAL
jgi:thioredoxin reductase (NADPH)